MSKVVRVRGESQKNMIKLLDRLNGKYSRWEIWQDFIIMSAVSIANTLGGAQTESRERMYHERADKYSDAEKTVFAEMFSEMVLGMEQNPDQDYLGELFMALELGNEWRGQFFTPYSVCRMMAAMTIGSGFKEQVSDRGWVSVSDPACGAGALLIAFTNECMRPNIDVNYQTSVLFVAQDIDFLAGLMCYIQLSLMGCPGYVVIDDTICHPSTSYDKRGLIPKDGPQVWYTPMYFRDVWHWRRAWAQLGMLFPSTPVPQEITEPVPAPEVIVPADVQYSETKAGQLTLF